MRVPPHNIEAEMSVLGAMLLGDRGAIERATALVAAEDFYRPAHGEVFDAMWTLNGRDEPVDPVTLKDELLRRGTLESVGGVGYLLQLGDVEFTTAHVEQYARIVKDKAILRRSIETASELATLAYAGEMPPGDIADIALTRLLALSEEEADEHPWMSPDDLDRVFAADVSERRERGGGMVGASTGFRGIDRHLLGFEAGCLYVVAGRPGMGKSVIASQFADAVAKEGRTVAVFSAEMSAVNWQTRRVVQHSRVPYEVIRRTDWDAGDYERIQEARRLLKSLPVYVESTPTISIHRMENKLRQLRAKRGRIGAILVDYLQYVLPPDEMRGVNRQQQVTEIARRFKRLARVYNCPLIAVSQLNREVEKREDKRPQLSDLYESGGIEAEADVVAFLYRPAYYSKKADPAFIENDAEFLVAKHRNGATATVTLQFAPAQVRFNDLSRRED